jgi:hypothetical protein
MADTCASSPPGQRPFSFGLDPWTLAFVVTPLLAVAPLATLLGVPFVTRLIGGVLGWYLRRKTDGRRSHLIELMDEDDKKFREEQGSNTTAGLDATVNADEEDEWEKVDTYAVGSSPNGDKEEKEWDGIVGFFHPFWWVAAAPCLPQAFNFSNATADFVGCAVTPAAAASGFCGPPFERRSSGGREQSASYTPATTM